MCCAGMKGREDISLLWAACRYGQQGGYGDGGYGGGGGYDAGGYDGAYDPAAPAAPAMAAVPMVPGAGGQVQALVPVQLPNGQVWSCCC